jgi:hypothetical protein
MKAVGDVPAQNRAVGYAAASWPMALKVMAACQHASQTELLWLSSKRALHHPVHQINNLS